MRLGRRSSVFGLRFLDRQKSNQLGRDRISSLGAEIPDWYVPVDELPATPAPIAYFCALVACAVP